MRIFLKRYTAVILFLTAALTIVLLYFFVYPLYGKYFPKCPFFTFTGLYCPGCGSQRAIVSLLHGDLLTAVHDNLLAVLALPFILFSFVITIKNYFDEKKRKIGIVYSTAFATSVFVIVLVFAILRNIPSYPFNLLAPL